MIRNILIAFVACIAFSSCKKIKDPVFQRIENIRMDKLGFGSSTVNLDMRCYNPNSFTASLKSAEGDAWVDSSFLGHFIVDSSISVAPKAEFLVPVKLKVDMKNLLKYSLHAANQKDMKEVMISIKGTARAGRSGFFRTIPINYSGKQNLEELFK